MEYLLLCLVAFVAVVLAPWGFGSLMVTISKTQGRNTKGKFWLFAIPYAVLTIGPYLLAWYLNDMLHIRTFNTVAYVLSIALTLNGILLSPLLNFLLKRRYADQLQKSAPNTGLAASMASNKSAVQSPKAPITLEQTTSKPVTAGRIFISYRRSDSADITGRIYDRLVSKFGREPIFKDVDSIPLGLDFKDYLDKKVGECEVLLAIIGDHWLDAKDSDGAKRLADPADFVRIELESALARGIPVIPLLVRGAAMPPEASLPAGLQKLVYRNGIPIRSDPDFHRDMDRLIAALEKYVK